MLKVQEIRELIKLVDQSNLDEFVYEVDDCKIKMKKNQAGVVTVSSQPAVAPVVVEAPKPQAGAPAAPAAVQQDAPKEEAAPEPIVNENLHQVTSPMVGTFYASPSPDQDAYVKVGDKVSNDSIVCIVEAMKLFNEIEAEVSGEIVEILVKDGQLVEYGQPLFLVKLQ
ncbi:acetyl-CoA carboxylase biotin carboxyl carrier protein [Robertmurraya kyonggiensis]|uniref:Biotin carboxyl carrier protein of acetyl-CoA carboxylase n=1 Tax=Robertmurraya kyonggiensis TaxID=1037680 RepID=A0A4U1DB80_9BACI|nr:acetyl-CoA carboxylase biotin carboxyl carrier protein [Robertmurraya kyonggiensis]TKC19855.1 acetyl-CoA carboxylase biotin carboxyl carrier protein [Robertmurraya kyonggiensis]